MAAGRSGQACRRLGTALWLPGLQVDICCGCDCRMLLMPCAHGSQTARDSAAVTGMRKQQAAAQHACLEWRPD